MKRILCVAVVLAMLVSVVSAYSVSVSAKMPSTDVMDGYENLVLTYTHNPNRDDNGRHSKDDLMPYVLYLDENGNAKDFFFDSYLFLPCMSYGPSGARMHYDQNNPTKAIDWINYVDDTFYEGTNVDALEEAFGEAKRQLNDNDRKAGVVLSILYPGTNAGSGFGTLGGKELDLSKLEDRKYAIKWIIDEQLKLFNERDYRHLDLIGFYWLEEYLYTGSQGEEDKLLFRYASEYLHSKGLKFVWIPWFRSNGYMQWKSLGFDAVTMQPNMYWNQELNRLRVEACVNDCIRFGMGVELEIDGKALKSGEYYNRYLDYLEGCMNGGAMDSIKMYYQDGKEAVFYAACKSKDARARSVYDLTYKYAKGILTQADIDANRSDTFKLDEDVDWISIGKKYTASRPYFDGSAVEYQNNDGTELTDGVIGTSELGTEWHAYHKTLLDKDGRMSVTIDLGEVRDDITHFMLHFSHIENYGIDDPADNVTVLISEDGESFTQIATPKLEYIDIISYIKFVSKPVTARYVKFSFINSNANFVFCSEALVGVGDVSNIPDLPEISLGESVTDEVSENSGESINDSNSKFSEAVSEELAPNNDGDGNNVIYVVCSVIAVVIIIAVIVIVLKKKKASE